MQRLTGICKMALSVMVPIDIQVYIFIHVAAAVIIFYVLDTISVRLNNDGSKTNCDLSTVTLLWTK